ncbi:hypothetical protein Ancab_040600 [Ancistrocladus abbreviatus]
MVQFSLQRARNIKLLRTQLSPLRSTCSCYSTATEPSSQHPKPQRVPILIVGKFINSQLSESIDVVNLATQEVVSQVPLTNDNSSGVQSCSVCRKAGFSIMVGCTYHNSPTCYAQAPRTHSKRYDVSSGSYMWQYLCFKAVWERSRMLLTLYAMMMTFELYHLSVLLMEKLCDKVAF